MTNLLLIFIALTTVNVIFSTIKSIVTIKGPPFSSALCSALYYGYYNIVLIYTMADFPLWQKVLVTTVCNFIGVYLVKWGEKKTRKDRLWKIEATFKNVDPLFSILKDWAAANNISIKYYDLNKYLEVHFYSENQTQSKIIKQFIQKHNGKYFITENIDKL